MNTDKNILLILGEWLQARRARKQTSSPAINRSQWSRWLPSRGNVIFTLLMIALLLWAQSAGALPLPARLSTPAASTGTIAYQGRLADAGGNPITEAVNMTFRLYDVATGGQPLWYEDWTIENAVQVSDGLFNVMLGSLTPIDAAIISANDTLWLGITAGTDDEMAPRVQLGSVPFAVQALTVPDGSVTSTKLNLQEDVGIGTTDPQYPLHIKTGWGVLGLDTNAVSQDAGIRLHENGAVKWHIYNDASENNRLEISSSTSLGVMIDQNGNVGIGTSDTSKGKTTVDGKLRVAQAHLLTGL